MAAGPESDPAGGEFVQNVDPYQDMRDYHNIYAALQPRSEFPG